MKKSIVRILLLLPFFLSACSRFLPPVSAGMPTPASPPLPKLTPSEPAAQPRESPQTASAWYGIPIMPGASAGEGDEEAYVYTVEANAQQIREYYEVELARLGWQSIAREDGDSSVILMFTNNAAATLTVTIITKDNRALVLLEK